MDRPTHAKKSGQQMISAARRLFRKKLTGFASFILLFSGFDDRNFLPHNLNIILFHESMRFYFGKNAGSATHVIVGCSNCVAAMRAMRFSGV